MTEYDDDSGYYRSCMTGVLNVVRRFQTERGQIPPMLISHIRNCADSDGLLITEALFSELLDNFPEFLTLFYEDDTSDGETFGPAELTRQEVQAPRTLSEKLTSGMHGRSYG